MQVASCDHYSHVLVDIVSESCYCLVSFAVVELSKTWQLRAGASFRWYTVNAHVLKTYGSMVSEDLPAG